MPRTVINLDRFQDEISRRILQDRQSHDDIIYFLQGKGIAISRHSNGA